MEEPVRTRMPSGSRGTAKPVSLSSVEAVSEQRLETGIGEFDRVLGGGIVKGSVMLYAGAPGIGKSTLLLKVCDCLAQKGKKTLYISGEESLQQIKLRSERLSIQSETLLLLSETDLDAIVDVILSEKPSLAVIDSIQTLFSVELTSLPGNVSQVRSCGYRLTQTAKEANIPIFVIGHMTKEGSIAGPRVLEHMVDGLMLLEGDDQHVYRILRSVKNRFGSTNEIGIFEMSQSGMMEVTHPSEYLLAQRLPNTSGSLVTVSMEGSRPLLVEIQALVAPASYGIPQRTAMGIDHRRLSILLAVLERRTGLKLGTRDVFVNAAGGLKLTEPGVDLAVALSLVSSYRDETIEADMAAFGEIGLSGEIRNVPHAENRILEAERMGFRRILLPSGTLKKISIPKSYLIGVDTLGQAVHHAFQKGPK